MNVPFLDLRRQYLSIKDEIDNAIKGVIDNTSFIIGKDVESFEKEFAAFCDSKYAIGVSSGTSALHLSLKALGIKPGDEVITTPNTFIATALAISYAGAKPVFADCDPKTYNIDINNIQKVITPKTKVILPVHLYGQPADMSPIMEIAEKNGLAILEDCCQSHGAKYNSKSVPVSMAGCFSFYPGKNLGAFGDGGCVVTDDEEFAEKIRMLRNYGQKSKYMHLMKGFNERLDSIQAAILRVKLNYLEKWNKNRAGNAEIYNRELESYVTTPYKEDYAEHVYHLYIIRLKNRDKMQEHLNKNGVSTIIHYPRPIHLQKAYSDLGYNKGSFPITEKVSDEILSLPMFPELKKEEIEKVIGCIKDGIKKFK